ncbi:hypothetical protein BLNAU_15358 [Blattamonas nauphoetae]|uniref:HAT C-terminal dimerisation domain-containing protein n=1 Tax=Blattamonas nauphoetae TaxID=2049346 RepID=A0ABQ9XAX8_9EUKA|nr:hypothetical protein BLNAU_15358 [Blattamonas nauphoetae]
MRNYEESIRSALDNYAPSLFNNYLGSRGPTPPSHFGLTYYDWWIEFGRRDDGGHISKLAIALETIAVSEVECERIFSAIAQHYTKSRRRLRPKQIFREMIVASTPPI